MLIRDLRFPFQTKSLLGSSLSSDPLKQQLFVPMTLLNLQINLHTEGDSLWCRTAKVAQFLFPQIFIFAIVK